jgi:hypothetical protein
MTRNRSEGWSHAKLSGHTNEERIQKRLLVDPVFRERLSQGLGLSRPMLHVKVGGINETNVQDVLGGKTKSKTDLTVLLEGNLAVNISLKKSSGGQVYLISVDRFIKGFHNQFQSPIASDVARALRLFFGATPEVGEILSSPNLSNVVSPKVRAYELKKSRLTWSTLYSFDSASATKLLDFFRLNMAQIVQFCFFSGLAKYQSDWADSVWYRNEVGERLTDCIFVRDEMTKNLSTSHAVKEIKIGRMNGGTTILLPFGFVQWHQGQMQFHHKQDAILKFCAPR